MLRAEEQVLKGRRGGWAVGKGQAGEGACERTKEPSGSGTRGHGEQGLALLPWSSGTEGVRGGRALNLSAHSTHSHTHTCTLTLRLPHTHTHIHTSILDTHSHTLICALILLKSHSLRHIYTLTCTHDAHTHILTQAHTHAHSHIHIHTTLGTLGNCSAAGQGLCGSSSKAGKVCSSAPTPTGGGTLGSRPRRGSTTSWFMLRWERLA